MTPEQQAKIEARARADAAQAAHTDIARLAAAGYSPSQIRSMMTEMAQERAAQGWAAYEQESTDSTTEETQGEEPISDEKPWWKFW